MMTAAEQALSYLARAIGVLPTRTDDKRPTIGEWKHLQTRRLTEDEARREFADQDGLAILMGEVSDGLGAFDFDKDGAFAQWAELVEAERPGLLAELPIIKTPKGYGRHVYFRMLKPPGYLVPAKWPPAEGEDPKKKTAIEVRADAKHYCCAPPTPGYEHIAGPFIEDAPLIDDETYAVLLRAARALNRIPDTVVGESQKASPGEKLSGLSPGDDWCARGDVAPILKAAGWTHVKGHYWKRPGDTKTPWSATLGYLKDSKGNDLLHVFSSNADPFEEDGTYNKFAVYAFLLHRKDFHLAAKALYSIDYGDRVEHATARYTADGPNGTTATVTGVHPGKRYTTVNIIIHHGENPLSYTVNETQTSLKANALELSQIAGATLDDWRAFLRTLHAKALEDHERQELERPPAQPASEIIAEAAAALRVAYRNERQQLWSESLGEFLYQRTFCERLIGSQNINRLAASAEFKGKARNTIIGAAKNLAAEVFANLLASAPEQSEATELGPDSKAAREAMKAIESLLNALHTMERTGDHSTAESIISKAYDLAQKACDLKTDRKQIWQRVGAFQIWGRLEWKDRWRLRLAANFGLLAQCDITLPGIYDQTSFGRTLERYGILEKADREADRVGKERTRVRLFSADLCDEWSAYLERRGDEED